MTGERDFGLDVLRSIAIAFVLFFHCGAIFSNWYGLSFPANWQMAGVNGVQLFFVLSGFLIGRLLIRETRKEFTARSWWIFMIRRWMRTLPLYYFWLGVLMLAWRPQFWVPHNGLAFPHFVAFATFTENAFSPIKDGWFISAWSLSVEEWFYFLLSLIILVWVTAVRARIRFWLVPLPFLLLASISRYFLLDGSDLVVIMQLDGPAIGVLAALLLEGRQLSVFVTVAAGLMGVLLVDANWTASAPAIFALPIRISYIVGHLCLVLGFALCLPAALRLRTRSDFIRRIFQRLSELSYSLYLCNLTVLEMVGFYRMTLDLSKPFAVALSCGLVVAISLFMHRVIERPIMRLRPRLDGRLSRAGNLTMPAQ